MSKLLLIQLYIYLEKRKFCSYHDFRLNDSVDVFTLFGYWLELYVPL
jgi:hypothetical protein